MDWLLRYLGAAGLEQLNQLEDRLMATIQEMADEVKALRARVEAFPAVIDGLESRITDALKNAGLSPANQALVDQAFADARASSDVLAAAKTDAEDGVDEGASTGGGGVGEVNPI